MNLEELSKKSFKNKDEINNSEKVSCYFCLRTYDSKLVEEFCEELDGKETACCPKCWVDSVLPGEYSKEILKQLHEKWFE